MFGEAEAERAAVAEAVGATVLVGIVFLLAWLWSVDAPATRELVDAGPTAKVLSADVPRVRELLAAPS